MPSLLGRTAEVEVIADRGRTADLRSPRLWPYPAKPLPSLPLPDRGEGESCPLRHKPVRLDCPSAQRSEVVTGVHHHKRKEILCHGQWDVMLRAGINQKDQKAVRRASIGRTLPDPGADRRLVPRNDRPRTGSGHHNLAKLSAGQRVSATPYKWGFEGTSCARYPRRVPDRTKEIAALSLTQGLPYPISGIVCIAEIGSPILK